MRRPGEASPKSKVQSPESRIGILLFLLALLAGCATEASDRAAAREEVRTALAKLLPPPAEQPAAPAEGPLTLAQCFDLAARNSERLASLGEAVLRADIDASQAVAAALPRINLQASAFRQEATPMLDMGTVRNASLALRQPLPIPLITKEYEILTHGLRFARALAEARRKGAADFARLLYAETAASFYGVRIAEDERKAREETIRLSRERLREVEGRLANGIARKSEALVLKAQIATDEAARIRAAADERIARLALAFLLNREPPAVLKDDAPEEPLPENPEAAVAEAGKTRPDVEAADAQVRAAEQRVSLVRSDFWPSLWAQANRYVDRKRNAPPLDDVGWDAAVTVDLPLFDGGTTRARDRQARSELREAVLQRDRLLREVSRDVRTSFEQLKFSATVLATIEDGYKAAEENYRAVEGEYRQGLATNLEVLTSLRLLTESRLALNRGRLGRRLAGVQFALSRGARPGSAPPAPSIPPNPKPEPVPPPKAP